MKMPNDKKGRGGLSRKKWKQKERFKREAKLREELEFMDNKVNIIK